MAEKVVIEHRLAERGKETVALPTARITYNDVFSLKYLYTLMHEWFVDRGYASRKDETFPETFYLQREAISGREVWVRWRLEREVGPKPSLWTLAFDIDIHVLFLKEVEVLIQGKKVKADKGEVEIEIRPFVIVDFSAWEKQNPLWKFAKQVLLKRFYRRQRGAYEDEMVTDSFALQEAIKTYLKLETFGEVKPARRVWEQRP